MKKRFLNFFLVFVSAVFLLTVIFVKHSSAAGLGTLSFTTPNASPSASFSVNLNLDADVAVGFVRTEFYFDPAHLALSQDITPGDLFTQVISQTSLSEANSTGHVVLVYGLPTDKVGQATPGSQLIGTLSFNIVTANKNVSTQLNFNTEGIQVVGMDETALNISVVNLPLTLNPQVVSSTSLTLSQSAPPVQNSNWDVSLSLSTTEVISGFDAVLNYDSNILQLQSITPVNIFTSTPLINTQTPGVIKFSQVANSAESFTGTQKIADIVFLSKTTQASAVTIDYTPGSTTDSNVVSLSSGQDILSQTTNLNFQATVARRFIQLLVSTKAIVARQLTGTVTSINNWLAQFTTDNTGLSQELEIDASFTEVPTDFYIKVDNYLTKRATATPSAGLTQINVGQLIGGDLNNDGTINNIDLASMYAQWFTDNSADLNNDGAVNSLDHWELITNFFKSDDV